MGICDQYASDTAIMTCGVGPSLTTSSFAINDRYEHQLALPHYHGEYANIEHSPDCGQNLFFD